MKNITSIICATVMALSTVAVVPVTAIATLAIATPDAASAWTKGGRPTRYRPRSQPPQRKINLACVQGKMREGLTYDQGIHACR